MTKVYVRKLLFETRVGEWFLAQWEKRTGLAVVDAERLAELRCGNATAFGITGLPGGNLHPEKLHDKTTQQS